MPCICNFDLSDPFYTGALFCTQRFQGQNVGLRCLAAGLCIALCAGFFIARAPIFSYCCAHNGCPHFIDGAWRTQSSISLSSYPACWLLRLKQFAFQLLSGGCACMQISEKLNADNIPCSLVTGAQARSWPPAVQLLLCLTGDLQHS